MKTTKGSPVNIPVICINDSNKPEAIPASKWIKKDQPYTIIELCVMNLQNKIIGVKLAEINIDDCFPWDYFAITRFGIPIAKFEAEAQAAIDKLLEETLTEPQHA